ncbi:FAD-dependent oxidoreductase [Streptomyces shenzhenensis]|uniref:FAD-dependent oxidoreductase n=1 Tax=Streptomyces shenzhenensis TaxID=943815 RepID=UPI003556EDF6
MHPVHHQRGHWSAGCLRRERERLSVESKLLIVGGGVVGCAIALEARNIFDSVVLIDAREGLGLAASSAAIGGITPQSDDFCRGPLRVLAEESRRMYPDWLKFLESQSGVSVPFLQSGLLQVALNEEEADRLHDQVVPQWIAQGFAVEHLAPESVAGAEPLLSRQVKSAVRLPSEAALEPAVLMSALVGALTKDPGVTVMSGVRVEGVRRSGSGAEIDLGTRGTLRGDACVVAAGAWSPELVPTGERAQFPVRGQAAELRVPGSRAYSLRHHIYSKIPVEGETVSSYVVPRSDGRVVVGVTYDEDRWDEAPEEQATRSLLDALHIMVPSSDRWALLRSWAGVRPGTADGYPLIGPIDEDGRVVLATGHFGVGITLAPVTGALVTALLSRTRVSESHLAALRMMNPRRFM